MILGTILKLLLAMGAGYWLHMKGAFTPEVNQKISFFVMNIAYPLMILTSMNSAKGIDKMEIFDFILAGIGFYICMPIIAFVLARLVFVSKEERPIYRVFFTFANVLFMGYPVAAALYGPGCMFYLSVFNLAFHLMYFTYGIKCISTGVPKTDEKFNLRAVLNNGTIAAIVAIVMFFTDIYLPANIVDALAFLGDMASPLSMVVIGATIGTYSLKSVFTDNKKLYLVAVIRLIVIPFALYWVLTFLGFDGALRGCATISIGMPVGSMVSMGCLERKNFEKIGPSAVVLTTILSLLTIPFLLVFLG